MFLVSVFLYLLVCWYSLVLFCFLYMSVCLCIDMLIIYMTGAQEKEEEDALDALGLES